MISTKGRYSIRILLDLAEHRGVGYTPIKDVAARQSISLKYVEKLMPALKNAGLLDSSHGIGGGYRLNRDPEQYDLWEILRVTEGELAPVSCLQTDASPCQRAGECRTFPRRPAAPPRASQAPGRRRPPSKNRPGKAPAPQAERLSAVWDTGMGFPLPARPRSCTSLPAECRTV